LHFVHHRHANSNFAVIHFFWDRILGTYRRPDWTASGRMEPFGSAVRSCRSGPHLGRTAAIEKQHSWSIDQSWPPPAAPDARALRPLPRPARGDPSASPFQPQ
jgi:hypothetical protein